ncbi:MAG: 50S ribosomal protein L15 [Pedobacter sp.]|jgi:large subunit ribosomal protein L15|nr:MAG: 50S ribosomal protein L15 [Pedobacter sp.]
MQLNNLRPAEGSTKNRKRIGRGTGSGRGGTSTRGHKGAKSRSGYKSKAHFEGGQMPLQRRVPKFGFKNHNRVEYRSVNLDVLENLASKFNLTSIGLEELKNHGLSSRNSLIKILGRGEVKSAVEVSAHAFSESAIEAIEKAGGKAIKL